MNPSPDPAVVEWVNAHDADTVLCTVVLPELASGVEALDEGKRKSAWRKELKFIQEDYGGRILAFDEGAVPSCYPGSCVALSFLDWLPALLRGSAKPR